MQIDASFAQALLDEAAEVAKRLTVCLREMNTVARFGGDEFVVLLGALNADKATSICHAHRLAEKIRANVQEPYQLTVSPTGQSNMTVRHDCSVSIGVAVFTGHEAIQTDIMKWADVAMYEANTASAMIIFVMADRKIVDDTHHITQRRGNGQLRREIWVDAQDQVTRYNLAYINHALHAGDNGRVVGYDNQHGYHHRHYFGAVAAVKFTSFEDIEDQFQTDWTALRRTA